MQSAKHILLAGVWITISEFVRNEVLLKYFWIDHYRALNLTFETKPLNGFLWVVWSMLFAWVLSQLREKFSMRESTALGWVTAFVMMWITAYNLQVLPIGLLMVAVPLSLLEIFVALKIIQPK